MQLTPILLRLETSVEAQLRLGDPDLVSLGSELLEVLRPAIRQALVDVVELAAEEVNGQLRGKRVDIRLVEGEPQLELRSDDTSFSPRGDSEEAEARITVRLPGYLKDQITRAAEEAGDSINSYVIDTLRSITQPRRGPGSVRRTIEL